MAGYNTPIARFTAEYEVKKSRFIVDLIPCEDSPKGSLGQIRAEHPKAGHHCWAYHLGPSGPLDSSDDGEPKGVAGKPMLAMMQSLKVSDCLAVISRYFGGIKLGTGGLVRAYSHSLRSAIEACPMHHVAPMDTVIVSFDYTQAGFAEGIRRGLSALCQQSEFGQRVVQHWTVPQGQGSEVIRQVLAQSHLGFQIHKQ